MGGAFAAFRFAAPPLKRRGCLFAMATSSPLHQTMHVRLEGLRAFPFCVTVETTAILSKRLFPLLKITGLRKTSFIKLSGSLVSSHMQVIID